MMGGSQSIGLIDGNNFFASCEQAFQPKLQRKPLIILSSNDGCVIARSNEAKALGIPMGAPLFTLKDFIHTHQVHVLSSNFALYSDMSKRMMTLIQQTVPRIEISSIDEAFIDLKGISSPLVVLQRLHDTILQGLGISTCVGVAATKTLAKLANNIAKKNRLPVFSLQPQSIPSDLLVDHVWGIGHQMKEALYARGIRTVVQLQQVDPRWMRQRFSVIGERLVRELQGVACLPLQNIKDRKQSIQISRSFGKAVTCINDLHEAVAMHVERLGEKLRQENLLTDHITLFIKSSHFHQQGEQSATHPIVLEEPTQDTRILLQTILPYINHLFKQGIRYKKAGITAINLIPADNARQKRGLFPPTLSRSSPSVSHVLDEVRQKYGRGKLGFGYLGMPSPKDWMVKCNHQSPHYTTRWKDLLVVG